MTIKLAKRRRGTANLGPSRRTPFFGLQTAPDFHETRTDEFDPSATCGSAVTHVCFGRRLFAAYRKVQAARRWLCCYNLPIGE